MERQLVFPFVIEDNLQNNKTCARCKHESKCRASYALSEDNTCGDWEFKQ